MLPCAEWNHSKLHLLKTGSLKNVKERDFSFKTITTIWLLVVWKCGWIKLAIPYHLERINTYVVLWFSLDTFWIPMRLIWRWWRWWRSKCSISLGWEAQLQPCSDLTSYLLPTYLYIKMPNKPCLWKMTTLYTVYGFRLLLSIFGFF